MVYARWIRGSNNHPLGGMQSLFVRAVEGAVLAHSPPIQIGFALNFSVIKRTNKKEEAEKQERSLVRTRDA